MKIYENINELVGNTPLFKLNNTIKKQGLSANIYAKLEWFNPGGSIKDRVAKSMLDDAEARGIITSGATIIEATSGNTGIGLAAIGVARGYSVILVMPETMSVERQKLIKAYGGQVVLTDGKLGMQGAVDKAKEINKNTPNSFIPSQFDNPKNNYAHYTTTGKEIYEDLDGNIDIFVAGVGTGGTLSGIGRYLKEKNPNIKIIAVEPASSPLISKGYSGAHKIQGIGANMIPENFDSSVCDEVISITDDEAISTAREFAKTEGVLIGISSGANLMASIILSKREENKGKNIVTTFADNGERYLSTELYK